MAAPRCRLHTMVKAALRAMLQMVALCTVLQSAVLHCAGLESARIHGTDV